MKQDIELIKHVNYSIENARRNISKIGDCNWPLYIEGYTSGKIRHLLNNLCANNDNVNYLEVGTHKGATFISAAYRNAGTFIGLDNWSVYGNQEDVIYESINKLDNKQDIKFLRNQIIIYSKHLQDIYM